MPHVGLDSTIELDRSPTAWLLVEQLQNVGMRLSLIFLAHVVDRPAGNTQDFCEFSLLPPFVRELQDTCSRDGTRASFPVGNKPFQLSSFCFG